MQITKAQVNLSKNVIKARGRKELTQIAMATEAGVGRRTIQRLEACEGNPKLSTLLKVANVAQKNVSSLLGQRAV